MRLAFFRWLLAAFFALFGSAASAEIILTPDEIEQTLSYGPWPPEYGRDPSNRVSGDPDAIALGEALFNDTALSTDGSMSCATCHDPASDFTENKPRSMGRVLLDRNTPSLNNLRQHRWFGWAGDSDNLWAQTILPIINPDEMGATDATLKDLILNGTYGAKYESLFGPANNHDPQMVLVNLAKSLAAYQETLTTKKASFDFFRDALAAQDLQAASNYPVSAQRGLKIFLGKGRCGFCHTGPSFTNGEFHDAAVPYFLERGRVDEGRHGGLKKLRKSPYTLAGAFNDDPDKKGAWAVQSVRASHADFGTFRVPSLRGAARTAPYMHDGSLSDLEAVIEHYNTINIERLHADGEAILVPLGLDEQEVSDLLSFLNTLSDDDGPVADHD